MLLPLMLLPLWQPIIIHHQRRAAQLSMLCKMLWQVQYTATCTSLNLMIFSLTCASLSMLTTQLAAQQAAQKKPAPQDATQQTATTQKADGLEGGMSSSAASVAPHAKKRKTNSPAGKAEPTGGKSKAADAKKLKTCGRKPKASTELQ